jgi:hypothetical protein
VSFEFIGWDYFGFCWDCFGFGFGFDQKCGCAYVS